MNTLLRRKANAELRKYRTNRKIKINTTFKKVIANVCDDFFYTQIVSIIYESFGNELEYNDIYLKYGEILDKIEWKIIQSIDK